MRRRQHHPYYPHPTNVGSPLLTEPDLDPNHMMDPESPPDHDKSYEDDDDLIHRAPLVKSFDLLHGDSEKKKGLSIFPRNYNARRRFFLSGIVCLAIFFLLMKKTSNATTTTSKEGTQNNMMSHFLFVVAAIVPS
jgi:hypothetical protein